MHRQVQVLRRAHHPRLGQALVVPEEDLLPDRGAQLVRDPHHLHDPAQQWSPGERDTSTQLNTRFVLTSFGLFFYHHINTHFSVLLYYDNK